MKFRTFSISAAAILATVYAVRLAAQGFTHAPAEDFNNHDGFTSLFDGKSLSGWDGDPKLWSVKDGAIYINPSCEHPTGTVYIVWQGGEVGDFDLRLEMKGTGAINGGLQYRSWITADEPPVNVNGAPAGRAGRGGSGRGGRAGGGRANANATPAACPSGQPRGTAPSRESQVKWNMSGYQFDFDNGNRYPGQLYEQSTGRGIIAWKGEVVDIWPGNKKTLLSELGDKATVDSWYKKDDWNTEEIIAKGTVLTHLLNGHLISETIDHDSTIGKMRGKIGIEVESTGELFVRNLWLKKYN
ncbi:MAG TPA: DUF1080 domain-containing protein [Bryobacteraceae bacterium]|nr:DUF1080 domain-containing protein [Bryobacteraceae bacterium]